MPSRTTAIPSIGIVGFGAFGQLLARHLARCFPLLVHDPAQSIADDPAGRIMRADASAVAACDIVILATPVEQIRPAIATLRPNLKPGAIVIDVGSVKLEPVAIMQEDLPENVEIIGTHPLFGPNSARDGLAGLKIAICPVRGRSVFRIAAFLRRVLGLRVLFTTPDAHDREMAVSQGLTHLIARALTQMGPLPSRMTTASFDLLVRASEMVAGDASSVFAAIQHGNPHSRAVRERFFSCADGLVQALERDA